MSLELEAQKGAVHLRLLSLRAQLKKKAPPAVLRIIAAGLTYGRRLWVWMYVLRVAEGLTPSDTRVLWRSALHAPLNMLRALHVWREPQLSEDANISIRGLGVFAIRGDSDDLGHVLPINNADMFRKMRALVSAGDIVIDAGANIGAVSVFLARQVGLSGSVTAVEMMPDTAKRLRHNLSLNGFGFVRVVELALSDKAECTVTAELPDKLFGQASLLRRANLRSTARYVEVRTTTLDELAKNFGEISLIKMDLEGAEALALEGAKSILSRTQAIVFESWEPCGGCVAELLSQEGFEISGIDGRNWLAVRTSNRRRLGI
ncbi:MAG: FkbM family methyltransferase [Pseudomonadales bacterium]|nr:FkbM family methyltransferase [Halioglobus sp.]MCP5122943.1 FkbM family methyltransferase [Pseudomonadales bacterium]